MKNIIQTTIIIVLIYGVFLLYLFIASNRFEKLENNKETFQNVTINNTNS